MRLRLELPETRSLKDKRRVITSLKERAATRYRVCAAEVDANDDIGRAVLGFAVVSNSQAHAEAVLQKVLRFVDGAVPYRVSDTRVFTEHYGDEGDDWPV